MAHSSSRWSTRGALREKSDAGDFDGGCAVRSTVSWATGKAHLLDLASKAGIKSNDAVAVIDQAFEAAGHFETAARSLPIFLSTWSHIAARVARSHQLAGTPT